MIRRGSIWWADLPDPSGSGPGYRRPLLIVQSDSFNRSRLQTIIGVALTSNLRLAGAPGNILLRARETGLARDSVANVSQLLTIDRRFISESAGKVSARSLKAVEEGLQLVLGLG